MTPYHRFVAEYVRLLEEGKSLPLGGLPAATRPSISPDAPKVLFFAPHPDDETIAGGLALRLLRESGMRVINVGVTQGSKKERQAERFHELQNACNYIGFELLATAPNGLERISPSTRQNDPQHWSRCVEVITSILKRNNPRIIFFPHEHDWNSTHIGTHFLLMDALKHMPAEFECFVVETEFWGQMARPNLMVEISADELADLIAATSFHAGEVRRNPYHLLLPAWMSDNVRRGTELVGGQGGVAPSFCFAALYRVRRWHWGEMVEVFTGGRSLSRLENSGTLFQ